MEKTSRRSVLGRHQSCYGERIKFYQTRSNAIILHETLPAYCIPKVVRMETGEVIYENVYMSPRPPPKIYYVTTGKENWASEHAQRPEVGQLSRSFQSNQPIPNPNRERTGRPVVETSVIQTRSSEDSKDPNVETKTDNLPESSQTRSVHESETFNVGDKTLHERTVRPVIDHDNMSHEKIMVNEADMDFRIPGLPHSVVKHAQSTSVRELLQKIENHPDRHALQQDLRQNQAYNPFSPESKKWFKKWATSNCLNCSIRTPRRSANHAYHIGVKASSIAHAGIS